MTTIEYLKERLNQKDSSHTCLQIEINNSLDEISDMRLDMKRLQAEINEIQISIEKLERSECEL
jgi:chromosome segregation ATPase